MRPLRISLALTGLLAAGCSQSLDHPSQVPLEADYIKEIHDYMNATGRWRDHIPEPTQIDPVFDEERHHFLLLEEHFKDYFATDDSSC